MQSTAQPRFQFGEYELDCARRTLTRGGEGLTLNSKAFELLKVLIEGHGDVLTKEELLDRVWPDQFVEENNLTVHISTLRKLFGERKGEHNFIATIPGKGYKFVAELTQNADEETVVVQHKIERIIVDETIAQPTQARRNWPVLAFFAACVIFAVGIGSWMFYRTAVNSRQIESIAVMPFTNESGNAETEYLSDGMTESLINSLSQVPKLTVKARSSVFSYKGKEMRLDKVGSELAVQAVMLGRIAERGDQIVVGLELVDTKTGNQLWGKSYQRKMTDLTLLQSEISRDVTDQIKQKISNADPTQLRPTENAEAYQLYLRGRFLWNKRSRTELKKAGDLFEQAIVLDPKFALAYAALGDVYTVDSSPFPKEEQNEKGRLMAQKALDIDPNLAEAHTVLAKVAWNLYDRDESNRRFEKAIELNPNYASARQWHAENLMQIGQIDASLAEIKKALELDPLSIIINSDYIYLLIYARQYDAAIQQANKTLELDPEWTTAYRFLVTALEYKGDFPGVFAAAERWASVPKLKDQGKAIRDDIARLRQAVERSGAKGYWEENIKIVSEATAKGKYTDYYYLAIAYAMIGDLNNTVRNLESAKKENGDDAINQIGIEPAFEKFRAEPAFRRLLDNQRLVKYYDLSMNSTTEYFAQFSVISMV